MEFSSSNPNLKSHHSKSENTVSESVQRNAFVFGIVMIFLQIGFSLIYGLLINVQSIQLNVASIVVTIGLAILVIAGSTQNIVGFGLVFGYTRRLVWSGIGFTFFITAFCIEAYPLINAFWNKTGLQSNSPYTNFSNSNKMYNLHLSDRQTATTGQSSYYGNSITNAIKCALSISIAFSSILGRAGHLECLIVTGLGIVGFELNRQIIQQNQGTDTFGTFYIFTFGGFMGLGLGLWSLIRQRKTLSHLDRSSMKKYTGSEISTLYAAFGALIVFALFPLLSYEIDAYSRYNAYSPYSNPTCIIAGLGAGAIGAIGTSILINGYLIVRDALHGPIAGAIVVGASSLYISNPVFAFVAGAAGGIIQSLIQNLIEKRAAQRKWIVSTVSWSLFGIQGIIGAGFASGWKAIFYTNTNGMTVEPATLNFSSQFQLYGGLISAGIGAAFGLLIGVIMIIVNTQKSREYFDDYFYWFASDGVRFENVIEVNLPPYVKPEPIIGPEEIKPEVVPVDISNLLIYVENLTSDQDQFDFSQANDTIANPYAFL